MINKKKTGSYYTPKILSDFLVKHLFEKYINSSELSILEPSCGDGTFVSSISELTKELDVNININLVDINKSELDKATKIIIDNNKIKCKSFHCDYLDFFLKNGHKYSIIIGNPPYIKKNNLEEIQIQRCEQIHKLLCLNLGEKGTTEKIKNIWPAFIESAIMSLNEDGILCYVIPAEILQVIYAKKLRTLISNVFDRVEIFAFNELLFEGIQQDVVALIGVKKIENKKEHGFSFYQVETLDDLKEPRFTEKNNNIHKSSFDKWTNYILKDDELYFIDNLKNQFQPIKNYCSKAEVGIVSAANDFFIVNDKDIFDYELNRLRSVVKPILQKGQILPNTISFVQNDFDLLRRKNKRVNFLHFPDLPKKKLGKIANNYIKKGETQMLHKRFKMKKRNNWYHVPSVWNSEALFVKRSHHYPKLFVNNSNALATDSFYRIISKDNICIKKLVFSFYNSLTFVLAELEGRFYGGGVLELTPNEFKNLSIPFNQNINEVQFDRLDYMLRNQYSLDEILAYTNPILLSGVDLIKIELIRKSLVSRRLKRTV